MHSNLDDILNASLRDEVHLQIKNEARFFRNIWLNERDANTNRFDKYVHRLKSIGFEGQERVLDAGCGFGQWSIALAGLNRHVDALDYNEGRVQVAQNIACTLKINTIKFRQADAHNLPYADNYFDAVFCYGVLAGVQLEVALAEFKRVLKVGGKLYAVVTGDNYFKYQIDHRAGLTAEDQNEMRQILSNTQNKRASQAFDLPLAITAQELKHAVDKLGFEILSLQNEGGMIDNPQGLDDYATEILCRK